MNNYHKIDGKISRQRCLDPDPDTVLKNHGYGSCPERLDPDLDKSPDCPERFNLKVILCFTRFEGVWIE